MVQSLIDTFVAIWDKEAVYFPMCKLSNLTGIRNAIALELFGYADQSEWSMKTLSLVKHTGEALKKISQYHQRSFFIILISAQVFKK